ncbi:MAG: hypothetical protein ILP09_02640 [Oscillospiraceae bacterium]|nr:hypothetical protein [Oscillospiraceae bacterium]
MKKLLAIVIAVLMLLSLAACKDKGQTTPDDGEKQTPAVTETDNAEQDTDDKDTETEPDKAPEDDKAEGETEGEDETEGDDKAEGEDETEGEGETEAEGDDKTEGETEGEGETEAEGETEVDVPDIPAFDPSLYEGFEFTPPPAPVENNNLFIDAYNLYYEIIGAMNTTVNDAATAYNAPVLAKYSEGDFSVYMDPDYLSIMFSAFMGWDGYTGAYLGVDDIDGALEAVGGMYKSCDITKTGDYSFRTDYVMEITSFDASFNMVTQDMSGYNTIEYDPANKAFSCKSYSDGALTNFTEIVPMGNDQYLFYDSYNRAIVTYKDGKLVDMVYSNNMKYSADYTTVSGNDQASASFYPNGTADASWVNDKSAATYLISVSGGKVSYTYQPVTFDMTTFQSITGDWTTVALN